MADAGVRHSREVWVYGTLAFAIGVAATMVVVVFVARGAIRTAKVASPLPKVVLVAEERDGQAADWLTALVAAGADVSLVDPSQYEPGPHLLVLGSLAEVPAALAGDLRRRIEQGGGIMITGPIPPEVAELLRAGTTGVEKSDGDLRLAEQASPLLARVRPGFSTPVTGSGERLDERPFMTIDARFAEPPRAALAHWTAGRARLTWFGFTTSEDALVQVPMMAVLVRAAVRWTAGQPVSDGASGAPREISTFSPDSRLNAQDEGLGFSAERSDDDEIEVTAVHRGTESLSNPVVRVWLPPGSRSVSVQRSIFARPAATLTPVQSGNAVDVHFGRLAAGERRSCLLRVRF